MASKKDNSSENAAAPLVAWLEKNAKLSKEEFAQRFPKTFALIEGRQKPGEPALKIVSTVPGFRRGGVSHPAEAVTHAVTDFEPEQIEQILSEAKLVVELVDAPVKPDAEANEA